MAGSWHRRRAGFDVAGKMLLDLPFGLDDEPQIDAIAGESGTTPIANEARVPQRIEQRGAVMELG